MGIVGAGNAPEWRKAVCGGVMLLVLAGCEDMGGMFGAGSEVEATVSGDASSVRLVERDVEAPDVFQVTDRGLWDGRPSLGGVWVAHPDVTEPERVIIRNTENSKFVIGALFRRERANPGPSFQVSSDAAAALGMLAGAPAQLNVTALRREEAPVPDVGDAAALDEATAEGLTPGAVETSTLDPVAGATAALEAADEASAPAASAPADGADLIQPAAAPTPAPAPAPASSDLSRPFIQIGIFSMEQNAENTATAMRQAGMVPTVLEEGSQGKTFWRVIVGPAQSAAERATLLAKIKEIGFADAYAVRN